MIELNKIYHAHVLDVLKTFPDNAVDSIITSPPYYRLRDYSTVSQIWDGDINCDHDWGAEINFKQSGGIESMKVHIKQKVNFQEFKTSSQFCNKCNAWKGELGQEPTVQLYIKHLVDIFNECKRVLKDSGTLWVNLGDTYAAAIKQRNNKSLISKEKYRGKCLYAVPSRFEIAMIDTGWILRNEIVWFKPNKMPESVTDRFTVDFEKIFFFTKNPKYFFEMQHEKTQAQVIEKRMMKEKTDRYSAKYINGFGARTMTRNKRCVWEINTVASSDLHYAMFPEKLVEPMISAGCPKDICIQCGTPRTKIYSKGKLIQSGGGSKRSDAGLNSKPKMHQYEKVFDGYTDCGCNAGFRKGIVLDIFAGSGTTCIVAKKLGCDYIGIELQDDNVKLSDKKIDHKVGNVLF